MKRTTIATVLLSVVGLLGLGNIATASPDRSDTKHGKDLPSWVVRPCKQEDSVNCRWNARTQGNGVGHTFIVRQVPGRAHLVCVFYADRQFAKHHDYCS